jgi:Asp-tRNA(Asn)/Glu-tRNA(Gln) amidotransferase A subunit family amidase
MEYSGWIKFARVPLALALLLLCLGCSAIPGFNKKLSGNRAFIDYWPPEANSKRLRLAVKDNIDVKGVITTAGSELLLRTHQPARKDAACLAIARQRNVKIVGKTNLAEFAIAPSGMNQFFGTPRNPLGRHLIPGGSSSGNAAALGSGMADVAFGTDTAGSIRVPAACCGIVGLKTTRGLISIAGVYPVEPQHLDTVGPMAKDIAHTVEGMNLLQAGFADKYAAAQAAKPSASSIRVGRLKLNGTEPDVDAAVDNALAKTGFQVVQLDDQFRTKWDDAKGDGTTLASAGAWITDQQFRFALGVSSRTKSIIRLGEINYITAYRGAIARRRGWQQVLRNIFKKVDFIAVPTLQKTPPGLPFLNLNLGILDAVVLQIQNTTPVNFAGNPALAMPIPIRSRKIPKTSLQLVGPNYSEAELLVAGRYVEEAMTNR